MPWLSWDLGCPWKIHYISFKFQPGLQSCLAHEHLISLLFPELRWTGLEDEQGVRWDKKSSWNDTFLITFPGSQSPA